MTAEHRASKAQGQSEPVARLLARAAAMTHIEKAPSEVRDRTVDVLIDLLGVIALGSDRPELLRLRDRVFAVGAATVVGAATPAEASIAALLNGSTMTVHQFDEGHREARGHPGIHIVPAVLAVAEEIGADGRGLLSALLAGYEVSVRIGRALGPLRPGVHPHGNWATIGAAAAVAHLLSGGDQRCIASAIDGATTLTLLPSWETAFRGASIHYLFTGLGAQIGVTAGYAAALGFTPVEGSIEGFLGPTIGTDFDADLLLEGIDEATGDWSCYEILQNFFKVHPTCGHTHATNDAIAVLMARHRVEPEEIERVDVRTHNLAAMHSDPKPSNDLAARFSIPYTVAVALATGGLSVESFSEQLLSDEAILDLAARVHVHADPELEKGYPAGRPAVVAVRMRDGTEFVHEVRVPRGDAANPIGREEVHAKARGLLARRFGEAHADRVFAAALGLAEGGELASLSSALREAARQRTRP